MVNRYPREPHRFPRVITKEDIEQATSKNGIVDLSKMRKLKSHRINKRKEIAKRAVETRKKHKDIFLIFIEIYKVFMGIEFKPNKRNRIVSYRNVNDKLIRRKYKTDFVRLVSFYEELNKKYKITTDEFRDYILHSMKISVIEFEHINQNHIFGFVISEKIAEKYFVRLRRRQSSNQRQRSNRERHKKYFRNKNER